MSGKTVYFFCMDPAKDEVAPRVFEASRELLPMVETDLRVDGYPVLAHTTPGGETLFYVRTETVVCMDHGRYLETINSSFGGCDLAVLVNWHGGANAPDRVLCIHTVGDVDSGHFGAAEPRLSTNLARLLEKHRAEAGLEDFTVTTEATHWSGIVYGGEARWITETLPPFLDLEIGSTLESYVNPEACRVIARALAEVYEGAEPVPVLLYCGGMHFEETITRAVLHPTHPVALTHILPSRWMENEAYTGPGGEDRLERCIGSIRGGIVGFAVHEKLARPQRELIQAYAEAHSLVVVKRKALKTPEQLEGIHHRS